MAVERQEYKWLSVGGQIAAVFGECAVEWLSSRNDKLARAKELRSIKSPPAKKLSAMLVSQAGPSDLEEMLKKNLSPLFADEIVKDGTGEFASLFSKFLVSCFERERLEASIGEICSKLNTLTEDDLCLAFDFWEIRRKFAQEGVDAATVQDELSIFFQERGDEITEEGILPDLLRVISSQFPNPDLTLRKRPRH